MINPYLEKDWSELNHAYGTAEDVPALLAALNSADDEIREDAFTTLFGTIWHQGTVYPATVKALPELIRLFKSSDCRDRESVAMLLASIADGHGYYHVHGRDGALWGVYERALAKRGSSIVQEIEKEAHYLRIIWEMSLPTLPLLQPYLDSDEWYVRETIIRVFQKYFVHIPDAKPRLERRLAIETHEDVREQLERALSEIRIAQQGNDTPPAPAGA